MTDQTAPRKIAPPPVGIETKEFWDALSDNRLLIKRCGACSKPHYFPRGLCPFCLSADTHWEQASGDGEIYSLSTMRRGAGAPYTLAYVTLDEGVSMLTNIVTADHDSLAIGQRVTLEAVPSESGQVVPMFRPTG